MLAFIIVISTIVIPGLENIQQNRPRPLSFRMHSLTRESIQAVQEKERVAVMGKGVTNSDQESLEREYEK